MSCKNCGTTEGLVYSGVDALLLGCMEDIEKICYTCAGEKMKAAAEAEKTSDAPVCPTCKGYIPNNETPGAYPGALSRRDNKTEICSACGVAEALTDYALGSSYEPR